jgi:hypothetical protein
MGGGRWEGGGEVDHLPTTSLYLLHPAWGGVQREGSGTASRADQLLETATWYLPGAEAAAA